MSTPGLLFVRSAPKDPSKDELYNRFYNEEHLPDVLKSGMLGNRNVALRYKNTNPDAKLPYLALYPAEDTQTVMLESIKVAQSGAVKSEVLEHDNIAELIHFDMHHYERLQVYEAYQQEGKSGKERGQTIVCVAMEPGDETELDEWYRKQHLDMLGMCRGYRRCTRYKKVGGEVPRFLALHEYDCKPEDLPAEQIKQVTATEWSIKIVAETKVFVRDVYQLLEAQGDIEQNL